MNQDIARIFALYPNARVINPFYPEKDVSHRRMMREWFTATEYAQNQPTYFMDRQLMLSDLRQIDENQIFALCKAVNAQVYGDYRFNPWLIEQDPKNDGKSQQIIYVKNKRSDDYFQIDLLDGEVNIISRGDYVRENVSWTYWQWYFINNFAMPIYPYNLNPVELGIAAF
jgi:hypothetical protein